MAVDNMHKNLVKIARVVPKIIFSRTDRPTDTYSLQTLQPPWRAKLYLACGPVYAPCIFVTEHNVVSGTPTYAMHGK